MSRKGLCKVRIIHDLSWPSLCIVNSHAHWEACSLKYMFGAASHACIAWTFNYNWVLHNSLVQESWWMPQRLVFYYKIIETPLTCSLTQHNNCEILCLCMLTFLTKGVLLQLLWDPVPVHVDLLDKRGATTIIMRSCACACWLSWQKGCYYSTILTFYGGGGGNYAWNCSHFSERLRYVIPIGPSRNIVIQGWLHAHNRIQACNHGLVIIQQMELGQCLHYKIHLV